MTERRAGNPTTQEDIEWSLEIGRLKRDGAVLNPKPARVVDVDPKFAHLFPVRSSIFTLEGEGFNDGNPRRTVFLETPVEIDGQPYYLEVKGYGIDGKGLSAAKHVEGDLLFGTYIDTAAREFYFSQQLRNAEVTNIQLPVALFMYSEKDFIEYSMAGLQIILGLKTLLSEDGEVKIEKILGRQLVDFDICSFDERLDIGSQATQSVLQIYKDKGKKGLIHLAHDLGLEEELAGVIDHRDAGYIIRAVKSPIRVGSHKVVTDEDREIAQTMGATVRQMLELGFLDTSPHPGNWTTQGELVDFANVYRYPRDMREIEQVMQFFKTPDVPALLAFAFGKRTLKHFEADF